VRPTTQRLATLIDEASARSQTFRGVVAAIERTDGMVFVEEGRCPRRVPACLIWQLTHAGRYRVLFTMIDTRRPDIDLMASIGHELRHALEVLDEPSIQSTAAIRQFYLRVGEFRSHIAETAAARETGDAIRWELEKSFARERPSEQEAAARADQ
jgi:hypothetical protein